MKTVDIAATASNVHRASPSSRDNLGCLASSLHFDQELAGGGIRFYRKRSDDDGVRQVETPASDRGYLLGLSLLGAHRRHIYQGRHGSTHQFDVDAEASPLFLDQFALAIGTHVAERYGERSVSTSTRRRRLSKSQEARAKEMLRSRLEGDLSIADVAQACQLSRSYFTHAFRQTTGQTPHQWVLAQRVQRARELLTSSQTSLAEIATACGFADQSHLTRVFSRATGAPPAQWRRGQSASRILTVDTGAQSPPHK